MNQGKLRKSLRKLWCAIVRLRTGKHRFDGGRCVRCHRKQPVRKVKTAA